MKYRVNKLTEKRSDTRTRAQTDNLKTIRLYQWLPEKFSLRATAQGI